MSPFNLQTCARPNILALQPYRCARDDYKDDGTNILLDANENAFGPSLPPSLGSSASGLDLLGLHRYPDPDQVALKQLLCKLRSSGAQASQPLEPENLFVGVGSDEAIDALMRAFCEPGRDKILTCPPTYGMYAVAAQVNNVELVKVPLTPAPQFGVDVDAVNAALTNDPDIKLVYFCSPGNPTGGLLSKSDIEKVLAHPTWNGVVIVDEAYIDFAGEEASMAQLVNSYPNLTVTQTFSKALGLAGIRLGVTFAPAPIARLLNNMKAPYNISSPTSALACHAISDKGLEMLRENIAALLTQRSRLIEELPKIPGVGRLRGGTDSNFLIYEIVNADGRPDNMTALQTYERLAENRGVIVRFRGKEHGCLGCLRITVGTAEEVTRFLASLTEVLKDVRSKTPALDSVEDSVLEARKEKSANSVVA